MITAVNTTTDTTAAANEMRKTAGLNKNDFLQLFVTQLKNQDPMNPQDSSQFIGQLAQLTQVEQAYNTNTNLQNLLAQGTNNIAMNAVSFVGGTVQAAGSEVSLSAGTPSSINFNLGGAASSITVTVKDASGNTVKTITAGAAGAGDNAVSWDGTDNSGAALPSGAYSFSVSALDASGTKVAATPFIKGTVDGVDLSGSTPTLSVGNIQVPIYSVTSVKRS
ncbi:flagellar hook assembly protein FlgD [Geomonas sp. RF6]|uniref:flagellar hook assembly protein FlgD n=1 Tax=Geomonas sp. RF6 TaxID=2897342 RepID=UPI001E35B1C1|nr:FlgD immunoglobulin-like domain containing protein [Geomonas sp. RF6]UFS72333.1 flagellar hook assembly protein FlgD [Geomonas sp. RF6]